MLIGADTKVLVVHRRLFDSDQSRYFVGKVEGYEGGVAKIRGTTWSRDQYGTIVKKLDERTKILALSSGTLIVYQLPVDTDLDKVEIRTDSDQNVFVTDDQELRMDLTETPHRMHS